MNERGRIAQRHGGDEESPSLARLTFARIDSGVHLSTTTKKTRTRATTTPFDLASSITPKTWTLGRQSYAVAHDHVGSSALASVHETRGRIIVIGPDNWRFIGNVISYVTGIYRATLCDVAHIPRF